MNVRKECKYLKENFEVYKAGEKVLSIPNACLKENMVADCDGNECYYKELLNEIDLLEKFNKQQEKIIQEYQEGIEKIRDVANEINDHWVERTPYTNSLELAEFLLNTELKRLLNTIESVDAEDD